MTVLRALTLSATLITIFVAFVGSYVRGYGAGLACPDWPLCYGQIVPAMDFYIFLEWFHRMVVGVLSLVIFAAAGIIWWRKTPERPWALLTVGLLILQAVMGGLTVILKTHPTVVALHQGLALTFMACLVTLTVKVYHRDLPGVRAPRTRTVSQLEPAVTA
jgi:heme a synthase